VSAAADSKPVVLVVDDARFFREMIADILKDLPVSLATAANGDEAWQLIQDVQPRLLLLDLNIPGKSGYDLLKAIQQRPAMKNMKILVMSGVQRGEQVSSEVSRLGADGFLNKSFTPRDLQQRVRQILAL
jgi:CheY-like chemotaxis protein